MPPMGLPATILPQLVSFSPARFCPNPPAPSLPWLSASARTPPCTERSEWHTEDPQFLAEVLFAVTSMLSFTRLAYILPAHESLGTLQISIGKMIDDMIRFMFILMIILTAFLCGLNNIYVPYQETERLGKYAGAETGWAGGGWEHNHLGLSDHLCLPLLPLLFSYN
uniref:Ion transport domain-containing protein n=1 Tax=Mustela putorius furo TaxID=9669 RepID=M3YG43_MUSPF